jgi:hypothetical protein
MSTVMPEMGALVGYTIDRILADKGYAATMAPPDDKFRVFLSSQKRGVRHRSSANCAAGPPLSPSSAISKPSAAWAATISGSDAAMPTTPSRPPSVTTSPPHPLAQDLCCVKSCRSLLQTFDQSSLKSAFFTQDHVIQWDLIYGWRCSTAAR